MKKSFVAFGLFLFVVLKARASAMQDNLTFVDQAGRPIPDVVVRTTIVATPPAFSGTSERKSDAEGKLSIAHPCIPGSGSCCMLIISVTYQVIGKFGYSIGGGGSLGCDPGASNRTFIGVGQEYPKLAVVSAASYRGPMANDMIVASFGTGLASGTAAAGLPLPTALGGRRVFIRNSDGKEQTAQLLFVSPTQINFIMPSTGISTLHTVIVRDESEQVVSVSFPVLSQISPGFFSANAGGQGLASAVILRVRADDSRQYEPIMQFDEAQRKFVPIPIDLGPESEIVVLALFGTGWRRAGPVSNVKMKIGGVDCPINYVGDQPTIEGLDQINVRLPRALIGKGDVTIETQFEEIQANPVQVRIK